jgi:hypothetical protein
MIESRIHRVIVAATLAAGLALVPTLAYASGLIPSATATKSVPSQRVTPTLLPPLNDAYANAFTLLPVDTKGGTALVDGTNLGATTQSGEPTKIQLDYQNLRVKSTVWYKWIAPRNGEITVWISGAISDSTLAIFTGSTMGTAVRRAMNDDDLMNSTLQSRIVSFEVTQGSTYRFQVGSNGAGDAFALHLTGDYAAPANDALADAIDTTGDLGWTHTANTLGSTIENWEPTDNPDTPGSPRINSVWWKYTPSAGQTVGINTDGSAGDSYLAVFRSSSHGGLEPLPGPNGFDDNGSTNGDASMYFQLEAGYTYYFQVGHVDVGELQIGSEVKLNFHAVINGPTVTQVTPSSGPQAGGTTITITGTRFTGVTDVYVNGYAATNVNVVNDGTITADVPSSDAAEKRYVTVCHPTFGCSKRSSSGDYTYI